ncbi:MAG: globin [Bdellovibrio sp. CG10_big_fil_rev_8_21_14_0_10_47_8]|nr:MAG: globin [Bdellovibrio sp. CG10_big_fil_rev_8_21_14_0_10_47_8]
MNEKLIFGHQDHSYQSAGGEEGLMKLSKDFYDFMDTLPEAKKIRDMHTEDLTVSVEKLAFFLCGWLGGPRKFQEKYGPIHIPQRHSHLDVGEAEKEAWLLCMKKALEKQDYSEAFKEYLITQLRVPATRIQQVCEMNKPAGS